MYLIVGGIGLTVVILLIVAFFASKRILEIALNAAFSRHLGELPNRLVERFLASRNTVKGQAGELIASLKLSADYDRIYALHGLVDFLGIQLPKNGNPGCIHFIEVKTGRRGRLSSAQSSLKSLIENDPDVRFRTVTVQTEDIVLGSQMEGNDG